jgi:hypothetical protein
MATFYKGTQLWSVDFRYDGRARHWVTALPAGTRDAHTRFARRLADLYGGHATLVDVRPASPEEETQFIRGTLPRNAYCPVLRARPRLPNG